MQCAVPWLPDSYSRSSRPLLLGEASSQSWAPSGPREARKARSSRRDGQQGLAALPVGVSGTRLPAVGVLDRSKGCGCEDRHTEYAGSTRDSGWGHICWSPWQTINQAFCAPAPWGRASWLPGHRRHWAASRALGVGVKQDPWPHTLEARAPPQVVTATDIPSSPRVPWGRTALGETPVEQTDADSTAGE